MQEKKKEVEKERIRQRRREKLKLSTSICHGFAHFFAATCHNFFARLKKKKHNNVAK